MACAGKRVLPVELTIVTVQNVRRGAWIVIKSADALSRPMEFCLDLTWLDLTGLDLIRLSQHTTHTLPRPQPLARHSLLLPTCLQYLSSHSSCHLLALCGHFHLLSISSTTSASLNTSHPPCLSTTLRAAHLHYSILHLIHASLFISRFKSCRSTKSTWRIEETALRPS